MFKLNAIVILAVASCVTADPLHHRFMGRRLSARQQALPAPQPTGYPAAGVTPDIPFDLPNETEKPFGTATPQPDEVYGPPELNGQQQPLEPEILALQPEEVYGPPQQGEPDVIYGPPESDTIPEIIREIAEDIDEEIHEDLDNLDDEIVISESDGAVISVSSTFEKPARLVYQRFPQSRQNPRAVPARLTSAKLVQPRKFFYTARFQHL